MKRTIFFIFAIISLGFILSCSDSTENEKGNLTGTINLEDQTNHSDIVVAVYDLAYLDTTIVRINNEYPHIGVIINQHTEFDHRLQSPIAQSTTDADGDFKIKNIPTGTYNFVAMKDGWGFIYIYEIDINNGDNSIPNSKSSNKNADITLYEETVFNGNINGSHIFETDHHYIIEDDTDFVPGSSLEIQPGSIIRINPATDLTIHSNFEAQGEQNNMFWVTSNDGFSESLTQKDSLDYYNSMELTSTASVQDDLIEWGKWDWGRNQVIVSSLGDIVTFQNCKYSNGGSGLYISISNVNCINNNLIGMESKSEGGLYYLTNSNGVIDKNLVIKNYIGIKAKNDCDPEITNNYFFDCSLGIEILRSNSHVHHNTIANCETGMRVAGPTAPLIEYNTIYSNEIGFEINGYGSYYPNNEADIITNNIGANSYFFYLGSYTLDIYALENYYYSFDPTFIEDKIRDKDDYPLDQQDRVGTVYFEPFMNSKIQNAGVQ